MTYFKHRQVGKRLVEECKAITLSGGSAILLGPRFSGKVFVQQNLLASLRKDTSWPMVSCSAFARSQPRDLSAIRYQVVGADAGQSGVQKGNPFDAVSDLNKRHKRPVILLAANVDCLPQEVARSFLKQVRAGVEDRRIIAILSGELDFRDLVHGPHSEFNCAEQFVLQGFDRATFEEEFHRQSATLGAQWVEPQKTVDRMWAISNGNSRVSRLLITLVLDMHRQADVGNAEINSDMLDQALEEDSPSNEFWAGVLSRPLDVIATEPECCEDLETLIQNRAVPARTLDGAPGVIEFSGLGIRTDSQLVFASEFMELLTKRHLAGRPLADLYAHSGNWVEAFRRYSVLDASECIRPAGTDDRRAVHAILHALAAEMFVAGRDGVDAVGDLLTKGARYLLGFPEVSFWEHRHHWMQTPKWHPIPGTGERLIREALPTSDMEPGVIPLPDSVGRFATVASLPDRIPGRQTVVILSTLEARRVISREQQALANRLLAGFVQAYTQALETELNRTRLDNRDRHLHILKLIVDFLGRNEFDVKQILQLTGNELVKLGYRRVMFSLVDPRRERIQGILDCPSELNTKLAQITDLRLTDEPPTDIQQHVVRSARTMVIEDASKEPLVNPVAREAAGLRSMALIPILSRFDQALGTIHVERCDGECLTPQEVRDLELLGRQLAPILTLNERSTLVQECLDGSTEPLMVTNPNGAIVYANRAAAQMFPIQPGWQQEPKTLFEDESIIGRAIKKALQDGHSIRRIQGLGSDASYHGELVCNSLTDWRKKTLGAFIDVHDLRAVFASLDALHRIGSALDVDSALLRVMDVFETFGYDQVRMYVVDRRTGRLTSHLSRGLDAETSARFERGEVTLTRGEENPHSWLALDLRELQLFYYGDPDDVDRGTKITKFGLEARALGKATFPPLFPRLPGSYWLSLPLLIGQEPFGQVTIMCDEGLTPEVLETMKLLAGRANELLLARHEGDKIARAREADVREGLETSMSTIAHNLGSRLAALPLILGRYRLEESAYPAIAEINSDFAFLVGHAMDTIKRTREMLSKITVRYQVFDLRTMVSRALHSSLGENQYEMIADSPAMVDADPHLLESALIELIQNSRHFARDLRDLMVKVHLSICSEQNKVRISFEDNGPGVCPEHKELIFKAFFAHRPGRENSTGLGLTFVSRSLAAHSGCICENGIHGSGARFLMEIPVRRPC